MKHLHDEGRARQRSLSRLLAIGGIAHAALALVAVDLNRADDVEPATDEPFGDAGR